MHYAVEVVVVLSPEPPERDYDQRLFFRTCHDKTIKKVMESSFTSSSAEVHTPRSTFLVSQKLMMMQYLQGCAWRPGRYMKGWYWSGRSHLLPDSEKRPSDD